MLIVLHKQERWEIKEEYQQCWQSLLESVSLAFHWELLCSGLGWGIQQDPESGLKIEAPDLDLAGGGRWGVLFARAGQVAASAGAHEVKRYRESERANLTTKEASKELLKQRQQIS